MFDPCDQQRRILIIDDNEAIHDDFRKVLTTDRSDKALQQASGAFFGEIDSVETEASTEIEFQLTHAFSGKEGVRLVNAAIDEQRPIDMAFVDMRMPPGWDGLKTIDELWKLDPELEVVICSAYSDHTWSSILATLGKSPNLLVLRKPFDNIEVLQMSLALTEKRHMSRVASLKMQQISDLVSERTNELQVQQQETDAMLQEISQLLEATEVYSEK